MTLQDRIHQDPIAAALYVIRVFLLLVIAGLLLMGCAPRYLTPEEEAQMKEICGPEKSCTVLPNSQMEQIEAFLHRCLGI